jgi:SagB-type dehydrogenase family enzyme
MRSKFLFFFLLLIMGGLGITTLVSANHNFKEENSNLKSIKLPEVIRKGEISVEEALTKRRSVRTYKDILLSLEQVSQLLWAAQGVTEPSLNFRTAPSAGALYPSAVYLLSGNITGLPVGLYRYIPEQHALILVSKGDKRQDLFQASLRQSSLRNAPGVLIFTAIMERTTRRYGERGIRYVYMEAGHASQNVYLQAAALGLGTVAIGAFDDRAVKAILDLPEQEQPLYLMPLFYPQGTV